MVFLGGQGTPKTLTKYERKKQNEEFSRHARVYSVDLYKIEINENSSRSLCSFSIWVQDRK